jgi:hypothetical protein
MREVESTRASAPVVEAQKLAPQAYLHADRLRQRAESAQAAGRTATAQVLSEHALAAFHHAVVLARVVKAERRRGDAARELATVQAELQVIEREEQRLAALAEQLELQVKVARDTQPLAAVAAATPEREQARRQAARSLAAQARLLCTAARLIDADAPAPAEALTQIDAVSSKMDATPVPIEQATALRSKCLSQLTLARRPANRKAPTAGAADALLAELSRSGELLPFRDDRGVVVTLRDVFAAGAELTAPARTKIEALGRVARTHRDFPLLVVAHGGGPKEVNLARARVVAEALKRAGAERVEVESVGTDVPVLDPKRPGARARNDRLELVFVAPAS